MEELAEAIGGLTTGIPNLINFISFLPLVGISLIAFWRPHALLFILAFGIAYITGLNTPDIISGEYATTHIGITAGIVVLLYAMFCAGMAFKMMFHREEGEEE